MSRAVALLCSRRVPQVAVLALMSIGFAGCSADMSTRLSENPFSNPFASQPEATGSVPAPAVERRDQIAQRGTRLRLQLLGLADEPRGLQQRRANWKTPALAGGREDYECACVYHAFNVLMTRSIVPRISRSIPVRRQLRDVGRRLRGDLARPARLLQQAAPRGIS